MGSTLHRTLVRGKDASELSVGDLSTETLSTEALSTGDLSTEALRTKDLSTEARSTGARSTEADCYRDVNAEADSTTASSAYSIFDSAEASEGAFVGTPDALTVKCRWSVTAAQAQTCSDGAGVACHRKHRALARQFVERYHLYTNHLGTRWQGTARHAPWPIADVEVDMLDIHVPKDLRKLPILSSAHERAYSRILSEMSERAPDHTCFSPGVGPVSFEWLKPGYNVDY